MEHQPLLEAVDLTKRYEDGALAVNNVSFSVKPGEIFAMLGGNRGREKGQSRCARAL